MSDENPAVPRAAARPGAIHELIPTDRPDCPALVSDRCSLTYAELFAEVEVAAAVLHRCGLRPGDRLAATGDRPEDLVLAFLAAQRLGLVWVGVNRVLAPAEKLFLARDAGVAAFIADATTAAEVRELRDEGCRVLSWEGDGPDAWSALRENAHDASFVARAIDMHAPAALAYTSGTTGRPKGVMLSQYNITTFPIVGLNSDRGETWASGARRCATVPLTILNVMIFGPISALLSGGTYVCADRPDAASVARVVERHRVEVLNTVGTTAFDLVTRSDLEHVDLSSLRAIGAGGALVSDELKHAFRARLGVPLVEEYGLTEAPCSLAGGHSAAPAPAGAVGRAYPHLEVSALDPTGTPRPPGEVGEICARPTTSGPWAHVYRPPAGYWGQPEDQAPLIADGWLHTGDLGHVDEDGHVHIVGRIKDVILRGGANVYPAEIERVLRLHPRVLDVAVLGLPDARLGEVAGAYVEVEGDPRDLRAELCELCAHHLAKYKIPEHWFAVPALPRNAMSKPDKAALRALSIPELV